MATIKYSVLDLATVVEGHTISDSFKGSVANAQQAEALGYTRYWFAEHHNMINVASSATSLLIGHIAGHTNTIRVGSGGIMLPNHSPLVVAEQFGTLESRTPAVSIWDWAAHRAATRLRHMRSEVRTWALLFIFRRM